MQNQWRLKLYADFKGITVEALREKTQAEFDVIIKEYWADWVNNFINSDDNSGGGSGNNGGGSSSNGGGSSSNEEDDKWADTGLEVPELDFGGAAGGM